MPIPPVFDIAVAVLIACVCTAAAATAYVDQINSAYWLTFLSLARFQDIPVTDHFGRDDRSCTVPK